MHTDWPASTTVPTVPEVLKCAADIAAQVDCTSFPDWCASAEPPIAETAMAFKVYDRAVREQRSLLHLLGQDGYVSALLLAAHA
jgi:hypothetical protein